MKKIIYILVALALIAVVVFRLKNNKETTQNRVYHYNKEQTVSVQAYTVSLEGVGNEYAYTGTFEPNKETKISAEIQGKINAVLVDVGMIVRKGQSLILLDNSLLKLQLQSIEIQIEGIESDVKRFTILANAEAIQGVQLEKTILGLKSAKVQKAILIEQISKTAIVAPFDGIVTAKLNEEGAFAAPGVPLLQITDISTLKFTVNAQEQELNRFKLQQVYAIAVDAFPENVLSGKIIMIGSKANSSNSFPVQFTVSNTADCKIKAGMFGKVQLKNEQIARQITIPASAIVGNTIQPQVYLVKNGKAVLQNISILERIQNKAIISSGIAAGDVVISGGFINLFDGANVSIKN